MNMDRISVQMKQWFNGACSVHKNDAPFDKLRVTVSDTFRLCHGELVESMTAKLLASPKGYQLKNPFVIFSCDPIV